MVKESIRKAKARKVQMMKEQLLDKKVRKDAGKLKKDLSALAEDSAARIGKLEEMVGLSYNKAKKDLAKQMGSSANQWRKKVAMLTENAARSVASTVEPLKKDIGRRSSNITAKAQEIAVELPKNIDKKASGFPWAAMITIGLAVGFVMGLVIRSARQPYDPF